MVLRQIGKEIQDFESKDIQIVPGLTFNQRDRIVATHFAYNSKFVTGEIDDEGDKKYYLNINQNPCKVCTKAIDFDTKNIRVLTAGGGDPLKTWFMERDLKYWMRDKQFGKVLNRIFKELPIFGTVVLKIVKGEPKFVDLRNFVVEQSAETLEDSNYIIEIHNYTPDEFRKVGKAMKWEQSKIDETLEQFREMKDTSHIRVYERYGEIMTEDATGKRTYEYKRVFIADVGVDEYDQYKNLVKPKTGVELASDAWEGNPYWEFHMEKIPGRWLGKGVVETLEEPQIRQNEIANLQSKASYWNAIRLYFSRDSKMAGNLATDKRNGDVITGDDTIVPIDTSDRNLAFFNQDSDKWMRNRDELSFSYDAIQGERSPAGTPLGSTQIAVGQSLSYFEGIQENVALDIKEMLYEVILPQFEKDNNQKHTLRLVGEDLDEYISMVKNKLVMEEAIRIIGETGNIPSNKDKDTIEHAITLSIKQEKEKILDVPKGFYEGLKYDIDIDITGESIDTRVRSATLFALLQAITTDPTMTTDPVKRKFLYKMAEDGGINPHELFDVQEKNLMDIEPEVQNLAKKSAGGGVSAPAINGGQLPGQGQQTV